VDEKETQGAKRKRERTRKMRRRGELARTAAQQAGVNVVFVHSHTLFGSVVVGPVTNVPLTPSEG
jgi:hypothetical protein